nr:helix-turn-helix domain-containing protein [Actinomadura formosensis]
MGGDVRSDRWRCGGRACAGAQTDRPGRAETAADRAPGRHQLGALSAGDDAVGIRGGNRVPVIAQLVRPGEDTVREVIHRFNEIGLACLDPQWAGGRPRLLTPVDEDFVIQTATTRPTTLGQPFHPLADPRTRRLPAPRPQGASSAAAAKPQGIGRGGRPLADAA